MGYITTTAIREKEDLSNEIDVLFESERDMSMLSFINFIPKNLIATAEKHEWMDDEMPAETLSLTASGAGADWDTNNDITALPVAAAQIVKLKVGDILMLPLPATSLAERVRVKSIDLSANTIELDSRGWGGSTATAQGAVAFTAKIIGNAQEDGADPMLPCAQAATERYNYTQCFEDVVGVSGKVMRSKISSESERARQRMIKLKRLLSQLNNTLWNGARDKSGEKASMAGLRITSTTTSNVGGALDKPKLYLGVEAMIAAGGSPCAIHGSAVAIGKVEQLLSDYVTSGASEYNAKLTVSKVQMLGLTIELHVDKHMIDSELAVLDYSRISYGPQSSDEASGEFEAYVIEENAKQIKEQIAGYFTLEQRQPAASCVRMYGIT